MLFRGMIKGKLKMPHLNEKSGDIFVEILDDRYDLAIVFGHRGYSQTSIYLDKFRTVNNIMKDMDDPFCILSEQPFEFKVKGRKKWLWLINSNYSAGMNDNDLRVCIENALFWANSAGIHNVITNGINSTHTSNTIENRKSDDERTDFLISLLKELEKRFSLNVTLISLNDVFTRRLNNFS